MQYSFLGASDIQISTIGFGCMSLGDDTTANIYLLHQALEQGITYFDTADLYQKGENEKTIGNAFKARRSSVILATKVGNQWRPDGSGWDWNPTKTYILQAVEESLRRLQTDYIDLYQLHGGTLDDPIDETIEAFEQLKAAGKIRQYGISSIRPNVIREYVRRSHMVSVMMQYSLLDRRPEEACLKLLQEKGIAVLARGSVAKGLLIDKPAEAYLAHSAQAVEDAAQAVQNLAQSAHRPATQIALRFVLDNPAITSAVVGIRTTQQLNQAIEAQASPVLKSAEYTRLAEAVPALAYTEHR